MSWIVYTLYKLSMSVYVLYESVSCVCPIVWWTCFVLYVCMNNCYICFHVWMAPEKISFKLTGSPSLNKVFELNWIKLKILFSPTCLCSKILYRRYTISLYQFRVGMKSLSYRYHRYSTSISLSLRRSWFNSYGPELVPIFYYRDKTREHD